MKRTATASLQHLLMAVTITDCLCLNVSVWLSRGWLVFAKRWTCDYVVFWLSRWSFAQLARAWRCTCQRGRLVCRLWLRRPSGQSHLLVSGTPELNSFIWKVGWRWRISHLIPPPSRCSHCSLDLPLSITLQTSSLFSLLTHMTIGRVITTWFIFADSSLLWNPPSWD